jgi:hypothetical protein
LNGCYVVKTFLLYKRDPTWAAHEQRRGSILELRPELA